MIKQLKFLLKHYTQAEIAKRLGYKNRSSINNVLTKNKVPLSKVNVLNEEYRKCCKLHQEK